MATSGFEWGTELPTFHTPRLTLRPLSESDAADLFAVFSDPAVVRYWDGRLMTTLQDATRYIAEIRQHFRRRELFQWGVAARTDNRVIGTCTLVNHSPVHERAEIGFAISHERWAQGLGSEAVRALVTFAFDSLLLHRLEADVDPRNERSLRLLDRLGFQREGQLRERYFLNGERQDAVVMGLLQREWGGGPARAGTPRDHSG